MTSSWQKVGEVVDAIGSGRKQLHDGKEYDYVFDVDIQEGAPPLKLPYNVSGVVFRLFDTCLRTQEIVQKIPTALPSVSLKVTSYLWVISTKWSSL